jgi:hypothetical protein
VQALERGDGEELAAAHDVAAGDGLEAERDGGGGVVGGGGEGGAVAGADAGGGEDLVGDADEGLLEALADVGVLGRALPAVREEVATQELLGEQARQGRGGVDEGRGGRGDLGVVLLDGEGREQREGLVEVDVAVVGEAAGAPAEAGLLEAGGGLAARGEDGVARQGHVGAIQIVDERHGQARVILVAEQAQRERAVGGEPDGRRVGVVDVGVVVVVIGVLAAGEIVDDGVALEVERAPLGVEAGPHRADLLEAELEQRGDPRPGLGDVDAIAIPHLEIEAALDLLGRRQREQRPGVGEADVGDELVDRADGQRGDGLGGVVAFDQRVETSPAAGGSELSAKVSERAEVSQGGAR